MCGIAALFKYPGSGLDLKEGLLAMTEIVRHRGPDDEGYVLFSESDGRPLVCRGKETTVGGQEAFAYNSPKEEILSVADGGYTAGFGHRRLAILDLSAAGHQPLSSACGRYWITYNGEVYNYRELKQVLEEKGHRFVTDTDTEVILAAFQEWGKGCLHRFNGMFAFVIYDLREWRFFAARDRFGVKPLYFWHSPAQFLALASEIKQFTVLPGWQAQLERTAAFQFLTSGLSDHSEKTFFRGVLQLRGGQYLEGSLLDPGKSAVVSWYQPTEKVYEGSFEEACATFADLFKDAVNLRLRADVTVGSCLSGGLDSSAIVCMADFLRGAQGNSQGLKTFSARSDSSRFDEGQFIAYVHAAVRAEGFAVVPDLQQLEATHERLVWHQDEPLGSTSLFAQWLVFELAHTQRTKVMLDGQGADELLGGYTPFLSARLAELLHSFSLGCFYREVKANGGHDQKREALKLLLKRLVPGSIKRGLKRCLPRRSNALDWLALTGEGQLPVMQTVNGLSRQQFFYTSLPKLLHWEDRNSMAHSVESRTPFLDFRLVEFVMSLPAEYKVANGWTKRVLREGMAHLLPKEIAYRKDKLGFATAEEEWLRQRDPALFLRLTEQAIAASQGVLNGKARTYVADVASGKKPFNFTSWRIISFGKWMELFSVAP